MASPLNHRFVKKVNHALEVAVTYVPIPGNATEIDCVVEFSNTLPINKNDHTQNGNQNGEKANAEEETRLNGWFSRLWSGDGPEPTPNPHLPLLLGYIQLLGYVRLNHQVGSDSTVDNSHAVYWKNGEYISRYASREADEKLQQVLHTELFRQHGGSTPSSGRLGGVPDLTRQKFDATAHHLLHDLCHSFGTSDVSTVPLSASQQTDLAANFAKFTVPFYVTAQHLVFSSIGVAPGESSTFTVRVPVPSQNLPPSYNTKSTGSVGEGGLVSIAYSLVVGLQEECDGALEQRAVYFPMEFRPGYRANHNWYQARFLDRVVLDKAWPKKEKSQEGESYGRRGSGKDSNGKTDLNEKEDLNGTESKSNGTEPKSNGAEPKSNGTEVKTNGTEIDGLKPKDAGSKTSGKGKFLQNVDSLIECNVEALTERERRKSSVSLPSPATGLLPQVPQKNHLSYQIRVNSESLCLLTLSNSFFQVGDDIHFFLKLHGEGSKNTRVVGYTTHIEAHEIFHLPQDRKLVNIYKVTPTKKANTYADALMHDFAEQDSSTFANVINIPRHLTQQFQTSSLMDLKYFMVCRFVLNDIESFSAYRIDNESKQFSEFTARYKQETESSDFKFSIPLTIIP